MLDVTGPQITGALPQDPVNLRTDTLDSVTVTFSEAVDFDPAGSGSFTVEDVTVIGPEGEIAPTAITSLGGDEYEIAFSAQTCRGAYTVSVGPDIADLAGNLMDQDQDGVLGETEEDVYTFSFDAFDADTVFTSETTIEVGDTTYDGQDICIDRTTLTVDGTHNFNSVHLIEGAVVTHTADSTTGLDLSVTEEVIIDDSSLVLADGLGYGSNSGPGAGVEGDGGGGGGYGGSGANGSTAEGGGVYGSLTEPVDFGSGGGRSPVFNTAGGVGGGAIRLTVDGTLLVDGSVTANGQAPTYAAAGGGSGGSVWLTVGTLAGEGMISADGGDGASGQPHIWGGGGGGGRIAVYYGTDTFTGTLSASGGRNGSGGGWGGAGTIFLAGAEAAPSVSSDTRPTGFVPTLVDHMDVVFTRAIDPSTFADDDIDLRGPSGAVPVTGIALVDEVAGWQTYRASFPSQETNGIYHFSIGPNITGTNGLLIDQDHDGVGGEPGEDVFYGTFTIDTVGPRITRHMPSGDNAGTVESVDVWFSEAIDPDSFTVADVSISGPSGAITPTGVSEVGFNMFRITFAAQTTFGE